MLNRRDRLMGILLCLQQSEMTSAALSERFEVTRRTIIRDIQTLCELGVPIYAKPGPSGGYGLQAGFKLHPLHLDKDEALAVLTALKSLQTYQESPFKAARWTVQDKIRAGLPGEVAAYVDRLLPALAMDTPERSYKAPWLQLLIAYTAEKRWIEAIYHSQSARRTLLLQPRKIYPNNGFWYCEAYSHTHGEERLFRVDRFDAVAPVAAPIDGKGQGVSSDQTGDRSRPEFDDTRIQARLTYRGMVMVEADRHIGEQIEQVNDDTWMIDFVCPGREVPWAIRLFYSLGLDAEVIEPVWIRQEIRKLADSVARQYMS